MGDTFNGCRERDVPMITAEEFIRFPDGCVVAACGWSKGVVKKVPSVWRKVEILREGFW